MTAGFVIWSAVCVILAGIGIWARRSKKAVSFFAGVEAPKVRDIRKYNRAVAVLWFVYAALFELLGLPLLFFRQNSAVFLVPVLGAALLSIALMIACSRILEKHREKTERKL